MKITKDMNVTIALNSTEGKYISITQKGNTLEVKRAAKKPKGGAKATLAKIQKILEEIDIDDESKTSLAKISKQIDEGYSKKNDEKFFYKNHSKKVHALAARISRLTTVSEVSVPVDILSIMVTSLGVQELGRLTQVSKAANTPVSSDWPRRAKALGWPGDNDPKEAKAFCQNVTKCLDKLGLHSVANQFISAPEKELDLQTLEKIGDKMSSSYVDFHFHSIHHSKDFEPFLYFLAHKTASLKAQVNCPWGFHVLFKHVQYPASSMLLPLATLMANINYLPNLSWFTTWDIDQKEATAILDLFPAVDLNFWNRPYSKSRDYTTPLYQAVLEGHLGWAKALVEKKADPNKDARLYRGDPDKWNWIRPIVIAVVRNKNTEMISLLTGAKADIPKSNYFLHQLMQNNPSDQVLLILDRLHEENHVDTPSFMNNRYWASTLRRKTLLQRAIKNNHPQEVLEKLVEMGAEITPTKRRDSPLLYARDHKKLKAAVWLTDQGASIPAKKRWFSRN